MCQNRSNFRWSFELCCAATARRDPRLTAFEYCLIYPISPPYLTALAINGSSEKNFPVDFFTCTCFRAFQPHNLNMENTRVFVNGLPPSCSNDQLRNHFASRFQVTDAHVLPKRRMGFVGFKRNDVAQQAVNYFNKTYMKMSKISVDLARPVCPAMHLQSIDFFPPSTLTHSVGLETDQYYCRLITSLQKRPILREDVMQTMNRQTMRSSVNEMPTARFRTPNCKSTYL